MTMSYQVRLKELSLITSKIKTIESIELIINANFQFGNVFFFCSGLLKNLEKFEWNEK